MLTLAMIAFLSTIYLNETYLNASIKTVIYVFYTLMMS